MSSTDSGYRIPEKMYRKFPKESKRLLESIAQFVKPKSARVSESKIPTTTFRPFVHESIRLRALLARARFITSLNFPFIKTKSPSKRDNAQNILSL